MNTLALTAMRPAPMRRDSPSSPPAVGAFSVPFRPFSSLIPKEKTMKLILPLVAALALCAPAPAQDSGTLRLASDAPVVRVSYSGPILMAHHADGAVTGVHLESIIAGTPQLSLFTGEGGDADKQTTGSEGPTLEHCWTDLHGAKVCVTTPVASTTAAGIARALKTHQALVAAMQKLYPPATP